MFLQLIWESYAWSVWQFFQVPRSNGYGNIPGKWTDYSGDFPLWQLCFVIQNYFRKKFENEMEWSFQKLFMMPKEMQASLDDLYDKIDETEDDVTGLQSRIGFLIEQKISSDNVYKYLLYFDRLYDRVAEVIRTVFFIG